MTTFAIATLGCKVNTYESQGYESALLEKGYEQVSFKERADVYIINTCAVTNTAGSKSRQKIHAAAALNPDALIAVVGCYAQTYSEQLEQDPSIDILLGSDGKSRLADMIAFKCIPDSADKGQRLCSVPVDTERVPLYIHLLTIDGSDPSLFYHFDAPPDCRILICNHGSFHTSGNQGQIIHVGPVCKYF